MGDARSFHPHCSIPFIRPQNRTECACCRNSILRLVPGANAPRHHWKAPASVEVGL